MNEQSLIIRETTDEDLENILEIERLAFGEEDEAQLTKNLLHDPTAEPRVSLLAWENDRPVGHVLFTAVRLNPNRPEIICSELAPLAILPEKQKQGIGGALIRKGLEILKERGTDLVFVLGHPSYYPRHGFRPSGVQGIDAPYPIPAKDADAWMVQELRSGVLGSVQGKVVCAKTLDRPEYWRE